MVKEIKLLNDKACKRMLSHKRALAIIIKTFIPEFKDIDLTIIERCIIGSKEKGDKIESLKLRDDLIKDNLVYYDLLYKVKLPSSNETIDFIINIEPQGNTTSIKYPLINRAIYYASRLLATQKIRNNHYNQLKKVYSIWIIADKNTNSKSSISNVYPTIDDMFGSYLIKEDYKLINVIMINIGIDVEKVIKDNNIFSDLFRLIRLLIVGGDMSNETRTKELIEHYDILMTKEDIDTMHWSNDIEESGFNRGLIQGELSRKTTDIQNIMSSLNVDFDKAAKALRFNETDKKEVLKYLNRLKNN